MNPIESILQFFFPQECLICEKEDRTSRYTGICKNCHKKEIFSYFPNRDKNRCSTCQNPLDEKDCPFCSSRNVFFSHSLSLRTRRLGEKYLMNQLKFQNQRILGRFFSMGISRILPSLRKEKPDGLVLLPSHKSSFRNRPFLPTEVIAERLSKKLQIPIVSILDKVSVKHQSGLTRVDRFFHARKAFSLKKNTFQYLNLKLLLIDDVFTTGSSLNEVSRILLEKGVRSVSVLIASRPEEGIET